MALEWDYTRALHVMHAGDSFFIPTLDTAKVRREVRKAAAVAGYHVKIHPETKHHVRGLRIWKVT